MKIEVTEKDLENITGFIKIFGISHFKDISGQQCLAHVRLMDSMVDLANRILKAKEAPVEPPKPAAKPGVAQEIVEDNKNNIKKVTKKKNAIK